MTLILDTLAALLGAVLARRAPRHSPVAIALALTAGVTLLRRVPGLPPWADLGLYLVIPSAGVWCAARVFVEASGREALGAPVVLWAMCWLSALCWPPAWWTVAPRVAHVAGVLMQVGAAWAWWSTPIAPGGVTEACALVLLAGDVVALLGPAGALDGPWWLAAAQAGIVGVGLIVLQLAALTRREST